MIKSVGKDIKFGNGELDKLIEVCGNNAFLLDVISGFLKKGRCSVQVREQWFLFHMLFICFLLG